MRLIDADALKKKMQGTDRYFQIKHDIDEAPTVVILSENVIGLIRTEIERLHYHPKLDFIKNDEVVEMALDIIDKYRNEVNHETDN